MFVSFVSLGWLCSPKNDLVGSKALSKNHELKTISEPLKTRVESVELWN